MNLRWNVDEMRIFVTLEKEKNYDLANCQSQNKNKTSHTCQNINAANWNVLTMMQYIHRLPNIHNQTTANSRQIIPVDMKLNTYVCDNIICHYPTSVYIFSVNILHEI